MKPYLWITYDYTSISDCLFMLDTILKRHSDRDIIHEIGGMTLLQALLEGVPIVSEFQQRLNGNQMIAAEFQEPDVAYGTERQFHYAPITDLVTVMSTAPNEAIQRAIQDANTNQKRVAFDLMTCFDDRWKVKRSQELADLGAGLVSCHMGWQERVTRKPSTALIEKVCQQLKNSSTQVIAIGDIKPGNVKDLTPYVRQGQIFAIAVGSVVTRSRDPNATIARFLTAIDSLIPHAAEESERPHLGFDAHWAAIDEVIRLL